MAFWFFRLLKVKEIELWQQSQNTREYVDYVSPSLVEEFTLSRDTKGDVATLDKPRLQKEGQSKKTTGIRKVEDPIAAKKAASEVCDHLLIAMRDIEMRKSYPKHPWAEFRRRFGMPFCAMRVSL